MFKLTPKLKRLDVSAQSVLRLQRSLGDVQTAFPGWQSQRATAYVCAFSTEKGARVAVAFYMKESCELVFYLNDEGDVARSDLGRVFTEGVYFAESLGFMLGDVSLTGKDAAEKEAFWRSFPLSHLPAKPDAQPPEPEKASSTEPVPEKAPVKDVPKPAPKAGGKLDKEAGDKVKPPPQKSTPPKGQDKAKASAKASTPVAGNDKPPAKEKPQQLPQSAEKKAESTAVDLDLGLSGRTPLVALRRRKEPPSAEELEAKRQRLLENLGRFFGSM